jgi:hypothetical protein
MVADIDQKLLSVSVLVDGFSTFSSQIGSVKIISRRRLKIGYGEL